MKTQTFERMMMCVGCALLGAVALSGCGKGGSSETAAVVSADGRCQHQIKAETCPFCHPELAEAEGFCGAHGVAEAICATCRPGLKVAFRTMGDWCEEHKLPDSQCISCNPELAKHIQEGVHGGAMPTAGGVAAANCEHGIADAKCPFCHPSLIESEGFCEGHDVAEALCVPCRPYMKVAFVAKGDWCEEHATPESQCKICSQ